MSSNAPARPTLPARPILGAGIPKIGEIGSGAAASLLGVARSTLHRMDAELAPRIVLTTGSRIRKFYDRATVERIAMERDLVNARHASAVAQYHEAIAAIVASIKGAS